LAGLSRSLVSKMDKQTAGRAGLGEELCTILMQTDTHRHTHTQLLLYTHTIHMPYHIYSQIKVHLEECQF
jgi:hypothetical protein